jgi:O-antigen ligase
MQRTVPDSVSPYLRQSGAEEMWRWLHPELMIASLALLFIAGAFEGLFITAPDIGFSGPLAAYDTAYAICRRLFVVAALVIAIRNFRATVSLMLSGWLLTASLAWIVATSVWSLEPEITLTRGLSLFASVTLAAALIGSHGIHGITKSVRMVGLGILLFNGWLLLTGPAFAFDEFNYGAVFRGSFSHKNGLALFLTCYIICLVAELRNCRSRRELVANAVLIVGSMFLIAKTRSASGLLMSGAAVLIGAFLWLHHKLRLRPAVLLLSLSCIALLALAVSFLGRDLLLSGLGRDVTLTGRTVIWEIALQSIAERPFTGFGYGSYWVSSAGAIVRFGEWWIPPDAHSGFIDALISGGIVLLTLIVLQTGALLSRSLAHLLTSPSAESWFLILVGSVLPIYNLIETVYLKEYSIPTLLFAAGFFAAHASSTSREPSLESTQLQGRIS